MTKLLAGILALTWLFGCSGGSGSTPDGGSDTDTEYDTDSETETDSETDHPSTMTECDGGFLDPVTNLCWQDPPNCYDMTLDQAISYCENLVLSGRSDWRLPTISELRSLIRGCPATETGGACEVSDDCLLNKCRYGPDCGCEPYMGPGIHGHYWDPALSGEFCNFYRSASTQPEEPTSNWGIEYWHGSVSIGYAMHSEYNATRCVRDEDGGGEVPDTDTDTEPNLQWIAIPGGTFSMGSNSWVSSQPVHDVTVPSFELTRTEVTVAQYGTCVNAGACIPANTGGRCNWNVAGHEDHPVNCVDWNRAVAFCDWAAGRLPSEAEWEYAARSGGQAINYPWGDETPTCDYAVMDDGSGDGCGTNRTWPVCSKSAGNTEQGLCDMAGNVSEWVRDYFHFASGGLTEPYTGAPTDGSAWEDPVGVYRSVRGGTFIFNNPDFFRTAYRLYYHPALQYDGMGFRCAR